jgi:16S rRNA (cytosine1402-N4)-methyltransferase
MRSPSVSEESESSNDMAAVSVSHTSVLLEPSITILAPAPGNIVVDGTFGGGGHSAAILAACPDCRLICVDLDEAAQNRFVERFHNDTRATFVHANFKDVEKILGEANVSGVDRVLLDLGTSTFQLLADTRGFSFNSDAPLAMTFSAAGSHTGFTAKDIVNSWEASSIADIIFYYGGERRARTIAQAIVDARKTREITTARELAEIIQAISPRRGKTHPATKTFQALRIAVNDEIQTLTAALDAWWHALRPGGRIAVITFHSLEDRAVKRWMQELSPIDSKRVITKKPLASTRSELLANPRSRSAKLRAIEKLTETLS